MQSGGEVTTISFNQIFIKSPYFVATYGGIVIVSFFCRSVPNTMLMLDWACKNLEKKINITSALSNKDDTCLG